MVKQVATAAASVAVPVIACLGLAFKPDIDDLRESPAMEVAQLLAEQKIGQILAVEPHIDQLPSSLADFANIELVSAEESIQRANIVVMLVSHKPFYNIPPELLKGKCIIDTRGVWQ